MCDRWALWSMLMTLSRCPTPLRSSYSPWSMPALFSDRASAAYRMSLISELLPEPDTPVTQVNSPTGRRTSQILQVVLPGAEDRDPSVVYTAPERRNGDHLLPAQVLTGQRSAARGHDTGTAFGNDLAPIDSGARTEIHHVVGCPHGFFIMLHDDDGIALVPQLSKGIQQSPVVPWMQADARFRRARTSRRRGRGRSGSRDVYAAPLSAGERGCRTFQRQVFESHVEEEVEPGDDFLERFISNLAFGVGQRTVSGRTRGHRGSTGGTGRRWRDRPG